MKKEDPKDAELRRYLEEDEDDFEEFEPTLRPEAPPRPAQEQKQWREDWDDEDFGEDFALRLKAQLV
jgi:hypothetical protein